MKQFILALIMALCCALPSYAQATAFDKLTPPLPTAGERKIADIASWGTVLADLALDTKASFDAPDRRQAFEKQAIRDGLTIGVAQVVKMIVHRERPCAPSCGIDSPDSSFYSMHTALAFSTLDFRSDPTRAGPRLVVSLPLAITTGGLRIAAGKHFLSDVVVGAIAGSAASFIR